MIDYKVANSSELLKSVFLVMISRIPGLTQSLGQKIVRTQKPPSAKESTRRAQGRYLVHQHERTAVQWQEEVVSLESTQCEGFRVAHLRLHRACQNRSTGNSQVEPEFFLLLVSDINPGYVDHILPLIVPTMTTHGLMLLRNAGIGKASLATVLANAVARYQVATRGLQADGNPLVCSLTTPFSPPCPWKTSSRSWTLGKRVW